MTLSLLTVQRAKFNTMDGEHFKAHLVHGLVSTLLRHRAKIKVLKARETESELSTLEARVLPSTPMEQKAVMKLLLHLFCLWPHCQDVHRVLHLLGRIGTPQSISGHSGLFLRMFRRTSHIIQEEIGSNIYVNHMWNWIWAKLPLYKTYKFVLALYYHPLLTSHYFSKHSSLLFMFWRRPWKFCSFTLNVIKLENLWVILKMCVTACYFLTT